jgi:hypothetical protein
MIIALCIHLCTRVCTQATFACSSENLGEELQGLYKDYASLSKRAFVCMQLM